MASYEKELNLKIASSCIVLFLIMTLTNVNCDFYTSISRMEYLLDAEEYLLTTLDQYFQNVQRTNERIKRFLKEVEERNLHEIDKDPAEYYKNPLNGLKTLKRISVDWKKMEQIILLDRDGEEFSANFTNKVNLGYADATFEELDGASKAIVRIQRTYNVKTSDFADGMLIDYEYDTEFTAHDCFKLGHVLYHQNNYDYSTKWLLQARLLLNELNVKRTTDFPYLNDVEILEFLAASLFHVGNYKMAEIFNKELLAQDPSNEHGLINEKLYETHALSDRSRFFEINKPSSNQEISESEELTNAVCRGDVHQTPREQRNLRCRYVNNKVPYCLIAPLKMEELNHDPFIVLYHNAIYENEMQNIINETENNIQRSKVGDSNQKVQTDARTSQTAWLYYEKHRMLDSIYKRLQHITLLNLINGEPLQVVNYGIGGHYGTHYDFSAIPDETFKGKGNRILTALFYISDVEMGGATVFPFLRLSVPPVKGSLLVWYNQHESLEPDYRTWHSACPVLVGSKWVCNEWFHQIGQEFTRPCSLQQYGHISLPFMKKALNIIS